MARKLHGTAIEAFWAGTGFLLCSTVFQPNVASFSHIFGRKPLILATVTLFFIGVMIAAFSKSFIPLLVGRCIQGIGGGGIIALTEIVVTDLVPLRLRGQWFGIISGMWSIGSVTGPIIGGVFSQKVSWRWIFYINLPFIAAGYVFVPLFLKLNFIPSSLASKLRRVDWFGSVLFIGSATSFLIPITWGGVMYAWDSWRTLVPLIIGACGLIVFIPYEKYVAKEPVIRLSIFQTRTAVITYTGTVIHGIALWCELYYMPLYFEAVRGFTPILSGVALFPATFTVAPAAMVIGFLITHFGRYRWAIWLGWFLATLGLGLLYLLDMTISTAAWIFVMLVSGLGLGILFPSLAFAVQGSSTNKDLAFAVAMFSFFRAFGQSIGVAIGGVIFQNQMRQKLQKYPEFASQARQLSQDAAGLVQVIKRMADGTDKSNLKTAYADSLKIVWVVMCALAGAAMIASFWIEHYDLDRALESEQTLRKKKRTSDQAAAEEAKKEQQ